MSAERVRTLSGSVPAFEVLDAVGGNVAELGHTAAFYWQRKMPAAAFVTTRVAEVPMNIFLDSVTLVR